MVSQNIWQLTTNKTSQSIRTAVGIQCRLALCDLEDLLWNSPVHLLSHVILRIGMRKTIFLGFIAAALCMNVFPQRTLEERAAWNQPVKPFRIVGNVYYVGVSGVTSFLIATPKGAILIDGGFPETAPLIEKNISDLRFHLRDVKYLLNSHAHYDHSGGLAELKRLSGAQMMASKADGETLTAGRYGSDKDGLSPSIKWTVSSVTKRSCSWAMSR